MAESEMNDCFGSEKLLLLFDELLEVVASRSPLRLRRLLLR
jgi:hypothetical protein